MNAKMILGGAIALSLTFAVGSASAEDIQICGATFESAANTTPDVDPATVPASGMVTQTVTAKGGALSITGFAVSNGVVSVTVQLVRQSPLGFINGILYLYGAGDLDVGFSPIDDTCLDFGDGDPIFDTASTPGPVTQTVTVTFDTSFGGEKFFKAAIEVAASIKQRKGWA